MTRRWVVNSCPLIVLGKTGKIEWLVSLCEELVVPRGVADELQKGTPDDSARKWIAGEGQARVRETGIVPDSIVEFDLDAGEMEVLAWAHSNPGFVAVVDDGAARKCAKDLGIPCIGTLGIILKAKKQGLVSKVKPVMQELVDVGLYVDRETLEEVLRRAGE